MINNTALVSTLAYVKRKLQCKMKANMFVRDVAYTTAPLGLFWHAIT
jgi:hypothetical protein